MRKPIRRLVAGIAAVLSIAGVSVGLINNLNQPKQKTVVKSPEKLQNLSKVATYDLLPAKQIISYYRTPLPYGNGKRIMYVGSLDLLGRASGAHIQVGLKDLPKADRGEYLTTSPSGWHNYKVNYKGKKVWLDRKSVV